MIPSQHAQESTNPAIPSSIPHSAPEDGDDSDNLEKDKLIPNSLEYQMKVWPEYLQGADHEDRAMAYDSKTEMDTILIFAGLFTAAITPFTTESYKLLKRDPDDTSIALLAQISEQLRLGITPTANATSLSSEPSHLLAMADVTGPYNPPLAAVICNILFFTALGLSLAAALMAVMIQRWSRLYVRSTEKRQIPFERARVREYLYCGLEKFKIKDLHEVVPIFLEVSVFSFYAGLILFLSPMSDVMMIHSMGVVFFAFSAYALFTILPLIYSDCPYETPLTKHIWKLTHSLYHRYHWTRSLFSGLRLHFNTLALRREFEAVDPNPDREERDKAVLIRTISHLYYSDRLLLWLQGFLPTVGSYTDVVPEIRRASWDGRILLYLLDEDRAKLGEKLRMILHRLLRSFTPDGMVKHNIANVLKLIGAFSWLREDDTTFKPKLSFGIEMVNTIAMIPPAKEVAAPSRIAGIQVFYAVVEDLIHFHKDFQNRLLEIKDSLQRNDRPLACNIAQVTLDDKKFCKRLQSIIYELQSQKLMLEKWDSLPDPLPNDYIGSWPWKTVRDQVGAYLPLCETFVRSGWDSIAVASKEISPHQTSSLDSVEQAIEHGNIALMELFNSRIYIMIDYGRVIGSPNIHYCKDLPWITRAIKGRHDEFRRDRVSKVVQAKLLDAMATAYAPRTRGLAGDEGRVHLDALYATAFKLAGLVVTDMSVLDSFINEARKKPKNAKIVGIMEDLKKELESRLEGVDPSADVEEPEMPDPSPLHKRPPRQPVLLGQKKRF